MALIDWNPRYSVKVRKFDDQHKVLIDLINRLHDGMKAGEGNSALGGVLQSLIDYTKVHFCDEMAVLQRAGFQDVAAHQVEHDRFVAQVLDLLQKYRSGIDLLSLNALSFLKKWLEHHILVEDKKYGHFLNAKGVC